MKIEVTKREKHGKQDYPETEINDVLPVYRKEYFTSLRRELTIRLHSLCQKTYSN